MGRKSQRGRHHGRPGHAGGRGDDNTLITHITHPSAVSSFSLQEEARNTDRHRSLWGSGQKLRHMRINFVSSGYLVGDDPVQLSSGSPVPFQKFESREITPVSHHRISSTNPENDPTSLRDAEEMAVAQTLENLELSPSPIRMDIALEVTGGKNLDPELRSTSPALSDSSVEIVVFRGRGVANNTPKPRVDRLSTTELLSTGDVHHPMTQELLSDTLQMVGTQDHLLDYAQNVKEYSGQVSPSEAAMVHSQTLSNLLSNNNLTGTVSSVSPAVIHRGHDSRAALGDIDEFNDAMDDGEDDDSDEIDDGEDGEYDAPISDEVLARLLSQQDEDGFLNTEHTSYDKYFASAVSLDDIFGIPRRISRSKKSRTKSHHLRGEYPSASLMADVLEQDPYNGFDVMDFERPSLRQKRGGRQPPISMDLSDSELEGHLQAAWKADRIKKADKKRERAELRSTGALGRSQKPNFSIKYPMGMSIADIKEEIKEFLDSAHTSLQLPPMEKSERALVHGLALKLDMKSKSVGHGKHRAPCLIKTSRTRPFNEEIFMKFEALVSRGSMGGHAKGMQQRTTVSYRDGEIVGAAAPEIGIDNRGRAMLEKMGWTTGTALGAVNNKGILTPISHTVKTTKAGLG